MRSLSRSVLVLGAYAVLAAVPCRSQQPRFTEVAPSYERSLVRITTQGTLSSGVPDKPIGTGFVVAPGGYVLTAAHVIEPEVGWDEDFGLVRTIEALDANGAVVDVEGTAVVIYLDRQTDLALLRIKELQGKPLPLGNSTRLQDDDFIGVMAFGENREEPWAGKGTIDTVFRSNARGFIDLVLHNIRPSDSGSPLFDSEGRVVGVLVQGWERLPNSVEIFGVPVNWAAPLLMMAGRNHPVTLIEWVEETPEFGQKLKNLEEAIWQLKTSWAYELNHDENEQGETRMELVIRKPLAHGYWPERVTLEIVPIVVTKDGERHLKPISDTQTFSKSDSIPQQFMVVHGLSKHVREEAERLGIPSHKVVRYRVTIMAKLEGHPPIERMEERDVDP